MGWRNIGENEGRITNAVVNERAMTAGLIPHLRDLLPSQQSLPLRSLWVKLSVIARVRNRIEQALVK
jgi:hypothetical protein